jgi:hypothetical protein
VQQLQDFTCGAAAFQAVCCYFGVGPSDPDDHVKILKTSAKSGTKPEEIVEWALRLGLRARYVVKMTDELKTHLDAGRPVICSMQAYGPTPGRIKQYTPGKTGTMSTWMDTSLLPSGTTIRTSILKIPPWPDVAGSFPWRSLASAGTKKRFGPQAAPGIGYLNRRS